MNLYAENKYRADARREGTALALSGGGYRAALFHLGAVRFLNEVGALSRIDTVSSVSGGSLLSALLADRLQPWPEDGASFPDFEDAIARPLRRLASLNIRTLAIFLGLLPAPVWPSQAGVRGLETQYAENLSRRMLHQLPERPRFIFCATDLSLAVSWVFERDRIGDYQLGYLPPPDDFPLARAVAASSCFPPFFNPMQLELDASQMRGGNAPLQERRSIARRLSLNDGGTYDNLGLEPVWKSHQTLLVSDGGSTFDAGADAGFLWRLNRYSAVLGNQVSALRKRWLIAGFLEKELSGTYWGIGSLPQHYGFPYGYSSGLIAAVISEVRTDLDAFSEAEQCVLENHGYVMAQAALRRHAPHLIEPGSGAYIVPHPEWMDEDRVRRHLAESHKQRILGRW